MLQNETTTGGKSSAGNSEKAIAFVAGDGGIKPEYLIERIAHKIRNPLSVITTAASQIEELSGEYFDDDENYFLSSIMNGAERLELFLVRLCRFGCPEPGEPEAIELESLLAGEIKTARDSFKDRKSGVEVNLEAASPVPRIRAVPQQIRHVLEEVLANAFEAVAGSGQIDISLRSSSDRVSVEIVNPGDRLNPAIADRLFDPFVTDKPGAAGLGLAIAGRLTALNKGRLQISDMPDGGIKLTMEFFDIE